MHHTWNYGCLHSFCCKHIVFFALLCLTLLKQKYYASCSGISFSLYSFKLNKISITYSWCCRNYSDNYIYSNILRSFSTISSILKVEKCFCFVFWFFFQIHSKWLEYAGCLLKYSNFISNLLFYDVILSVEFNCIVFYFRTRFVSSEEKNIVNFLEMQRSKWVENCYEVIIIEMHFWT